MWADVCLCGGASRRAPSSTAQEIAGALPRVSLIISVDPGRLPISGAVLMPKLPWAFLSTSPHLSFGSFDPILPIMHPPTLQQALNDRPLSSQTTVLVHEPPCACAEPAGIFALRQNTPSTSELYPAALSRPLRPSTLQAQSSRAIPTPLYAIPHPPHPTKLSAKATARVP